jgi:hypothetical protein
MARNASIDGRRSLVDFVERLEKGAKVTNTVAKPRPSKQRANRLDKKGAPKRKI